MTFTPRQISLASLVIVIAGLLLALPLKLLPSLLAGLLVFELVNMLTPRLQPLIAGQRARWLAVALLGTLVVSTLTLLFAGAFSFLLHEAENPGASLDKFMALVERARGQLPPFIEAYLPASAAEFKVAIGDWIKSHLSDLQLVGKGMAHMFVTLLIGMILGAIVALQRIPDISRRKPLAAALFERLSLLVQAFRNIVFAQIKISLLNTAFTGIFLAVVLPLFGVHLPLTKTLIVLTFLLGPATGNRQPDVQHPDHHRRVVAVDLGGGGGAGLPDRDPQGRVLPQRADRRRADQCQGLGAVAGDAGVRGRVRSAGGGGGADLLRVPEE